MATWPQHQAATFVQNEQLSSHIAQSGRVSGRTVGSAVPADDSDRRATLAGPQGAPEPPPPRNIVLTAQAGRSSMTRFAFPCV